MSNQSTRVLEGKPTSTPTVLSSTSQKQIPSEMKIGMELSGSWILTPSMWSFSVQSWKLPQNRDEVMSDPDPKIVEAYSSAAVQLALSPHGTRSISQELNCASISQELNCAHPC